MLSLILLAHGIFKGHNLVRKKFKWYENLNIRIRCLKLLFLWEIFLTYVIANVIGLYYLGTLIPETLSEPLRVFGTVGKGISFYNIISTIMLLIYLIMKSIEPDNRIKEIYKKYETKEDKRR